MDTHPLPPDDLNDLEQRLAGWRPSEAGLAPDAMLFAAGRASGRPGKGRLVWPLLSACLAVLCVALGFWATSERSQRLALLQQVQQRPEETPVGTDLGPTAEPPAPDGYLILRRNWEEHPGEWDARPARPGPTPQSPGDPEPPVLRAWQPHGPPESL